MYCHIKKVVINSACMGQTVMCHALKIARTTHVKLSLIKVIEKAK